MLKGIGYLLFGIGLGFMSPKFIKQYKKRQKHWKYTWSYWSFIISSFKHSFRCFGIYVEL